MDRRSLLSERWCVCAHVAPVMMSSPLCTVLFPSIIHFTCTTSVTEGTRRRQTPFETAKLLEISRLFKHVTYFTVVLSNSTVA